jgi:hypothetical protein
MEQAAVAQNWIATVALLLWPVVAFWLYSTRPVTQATLWTILGGYLLLPVGASIKLAQGIPQLDKVSIPALAALAGCLLCSKRRLRFWHGFGLVEILLVMFLVAPFVTSELNTDPVSSGSVLLPGVGPYDGLSAIFAQFVFLLPFFLGRHLLSNEKDIEQTLRVLVIAGLLYSLPIFFEIRMSPQLHYWFYGYYPSLFSEELREGGFRPMVFIGHGLGVAFFVMTTVLAATAFWRTRTRVMQIAPVGVWSYLSLVLVLCKGAAALAYGIIAVPLVRSTTPKFQLRIASMLVAVALLYPALRTADLVPTGHLVDFAKNFNQDRADSLQFRFDHEKALLDRTSQRIWFGWGRFGRSRIFDEWGNDVSVSDGRWVITLGQYGLFGFVAEFGLLALTIFRAAAAVRFCESEREAIFLATLALIIALTEVDLLPNSGLLSTTWLFAGTLLGRAEMLRKYARGVRPKDQLNDLGASSKAASVGGV